MVERTSTRRPWLAALLGVIVTGAGHLYLRRWFRAIGWLVLTTAVTVLYVPETALTAMNTEGLAGLKPLLPTLTVVAFSVIDAYLIAKLTNRLHSALDTRDTRPPNTPPRDDATTLDPQPTEGADDDSVDCPHCGKPLDPELEFCHWCTTVLDDFDANRRDQSQADT